jgi:uncharacterized RDD family membrane protein YckC
MTPAAPASPDARTMAPGLVRRLACLLYEAVLLFGVLMAAGLLWGALTQQRHALQGKSGLQAFVFVVLAIYFTWFWSHGGQTVAMKAWHIRVVRPGGLPVSQSRALARYLLSWLWLLPALAIARVSGLSDMAAIGAAVVIGVLAYAGLSWLRSDRQFWHDAACGTRLVTWRPALPAQAESGR